MLNNKFLPVTGLFFEIGKDMNHKLRNLTHNLDPSLPRHSSNIQIKLSDMLGYPTKYNVLSNIGIYLKDLLLHTG